MSPVATGLATFGEIRMEKAIDRLHISAYPRVQERELTIQRFFDAIDLHNSTPWLLAFDGTDETGREHIAPAWPTALVPPDLLFG